MFQVRIFVFAAYWLCGTIGYAFQSVESQEDPAMVLESVIVTANRSKTPANEVGSSFTIITELEILQSGQSLAADLLRNVPGLDVVRSGPQGQNTSIFMRGAGNAHTLVLIDGVAVNDPMSPGNSYDFGHMSLSNIERIEVVRGPQSTLYGSDAMAGVIHIFTKKGEGPLSAGLLLEAGSFNSRKEALNIAGGTEHYHYSLSASHLENDGYSVAADATEKDGYQNDTFSARLGFTPHAGTEYSLSGRYTVGDANLDNGPGAFGDDPNHESRSTESLFKVSAHWKGWDDHWTSNLSAAFGDLVRKLSNDFDEFHTEDSVDALYEAERTHFHWQNTLKFRKQSLSLGVENKQEKGQSVYDSQSMWGPYYDAFSEEKAGTTSLYLQDHFRPNERLSITVGGRYDDHDRFGSKTTWRGAASWQLAASSFLKASYGTGFKAPSLFQLFSIYGNQLLNPELSKGWDAGLQHRFDGLGLAAELTFFRNDFNELIEFFFDPDSFESFYINFEGRVSTQGNEVSLHWQGEGPLKVSASYTNTKTADALGAQLLRRPREKWFLKMGLSFAHRADLAVDVHHVGSRIFNDFIDFSGRIRLDPFTSVNAAGSLKLFDHLKLTARVENIFDEDYQEVFGYESAKLSGYLGLRLSH